MVKYHLTMNSANFVVERFINLNKCASSSSSTALDGGAEEETGLDNSAIQSLQKTTTKLPDRMGMLTAVVQADVWPSMMCH